MIRQFADRNTISNPDKWSWREMYPINNIVMFIAPSYPPVHPTRAPIDLPLGGHEKIASSAQKENPKGRPNRRVFRKKSKFHNFLSEGEKSRLVEIKINFADTKSKHPFRGGRFTRNRPADRHFGRPDYWQVDRPGGKLRISGTPGILTKSRRKIAYLPPTPSEKRGDFLGNSSSTKASRI